ncbi:MAG: energy transducer TonB [Nitrospira sp.]|nr:energy transducer TonB [Nitrospira sp.]
MTIGEFNRLIRIERRHHAHSWAASLLYHVIGLSGALFFMSEIDKPVFLDTFQWEVSMVEAATTQQPPPLSPPPTPVPPQPRHVKRTADPRPPVETLQTVQHADHEIVTPQIQTPVETAQSADTPPVVAQAVTTTHTTVVERAVEQSTVVQEEAFDVGSDLPTVEHRTVLHQEVRYRRTQADYGWLRDLLWKRIEELKRYPTLARANHWEGKVVVQAVIKADGTVGALSVAESSGHALLDEEALVVMKKASPLRLKHQLETSQITILIPISYRLEG